MEKGEKELSGYAADEIESIAEELFRVIGELNVPIRLGVLGLCRTITLIGDQEDLDVACLMIDEMSGWDFDDVEAAEDDDTDMWGV